MNRARTLLVGGNDAFLDSVVDWVALDAQLEVVGRAHSGSQALAQVEALSADLVLMDVILPDMSGFEVARSLRAHANPPLVVLLSFYDNQVLRLEAWAAGADGFVPLSETTSVLTPLVASLLRQRGIGVREHGSVISFQRIPPKDLSE